MKIRQLDADSAVSLPIQMYAFRASPVGAPLENSQQYNEGNVTLVAEEDGAAVAAVSAIPMRQNVRGGVYPMAGVAGVATLPPARRQGHVRALMLQLLGQMRESGHAVSALYPFRPSFYGRFGYVGLPRTRTVSFSPTCFADLLRADLPGEVTWQSAEDGYTAYRDFAGSLLSARHGFSVFPDYRAVQLKAADRWVVVARAGGEAIGAVTYRITGFGGTLEADDLLTASPLGRALLLQFFARHIDQVSEIRVQVGADELPELWATDMAAVSEAVTAFPDSSAPMGRVLSLTGLGGLRAGKERVTVEVADDPFIAGRYLLDGTSGSLEVTAGVTSAAEATLSAAGLSALVYGVLDPDDLVIRGLGDVPPEAGAKLRVLFAREVPYLYSRF